MKNSFINTTKIKHRINKKIHKCEDTFPFLETRVKQ